MMRVTYRGLHLVYFQTMNHSILLVDDNETAARTTSEILKALGYEVRVVLSGFDGLRQLKPGISLALTDVSMPGIDGIDFVMGLHESQPDVRVAFTSGFTRQTPPIFKVAYARISGRRPFLNCVGDTGIQNTKC